MCILFLSRPGPATPGRHWEAAMAKLTLTTSIRVLYSSSQGQCWWCLARNICSFSPSISDSTAEHILSIAKAESHKGYGITASFSLLKTAEKVRRGPAVQVDHEIKCTIWWLILYWYWVNLLIDSPLIWLIDTAAVASCISGKLLFRHLLAIVWLVLGIILNISTSLLSPSYITTELSR